MIRTLTAVTAAMLVTGCASIFNGQTQSVSFQSEPQGASIVVTNRAGEQIHSGTTPATVTLKRGAGYFQSESYKIQFSKAGFTPREIEVVGNVSGWYFGNLLLGGLIGMLAVDPATGGMYVFPDIVNTPLAAASSPIAMQTGQLRIVSLESLPEHVRAQGRVIATID